MDALNDFVDEQRSGFERLKDFWTWGTPEAIDGEIWHACDDEFADAYPIGTMFCPRCNARLPPQE